MRNIIYKDRPKYLNLLKIRLPVTGVVSIAHRISGVILVFSIPFVVFLLSSSLTDANGFAQAQSIVQSTSGKLAVVFILWALAHHFFAGIRFLLFDLDVGVTKHSARKAAFFVLGADLIAFALLAGWLI